MISWKRKLQFLKIENMVIPHQKESPLFMLPSSNVTEVITISLLTRKWITYKQLLQSYHLYTRLKHFLLIFRYFGENWKGKARAITSHRGRVGKFTALCIIHRFSGRSSIPINEVSRWCLWKKPWRRLSYPSSMQKSLCHFFLAHFLLWFYLAIPFFFPLEIPNLLNF